MLIGMGLRVFLRCSGHACKFIKSVIETMAFAAWRLVMCLAAGLGVLGIFELVA